MASCRGGDGEWLLDRSSVGGCVKQLLAKGEKAGEILVRDAGQIVERGAHAELLAHGGVYARLFAH